MIIKPLILGAAFVACIAVGVVVLMRSPTSSGDPDDDGAPAPQANTNTRVTVQTATLRRLTLHRYVTGYGTIEPAPATTIEPAAGAQLAAPTAGVVSKVNVLEGQTVNKGDVLVELNAGSMTFAAAEGELTRQHQLFAQQNTSLKSLQDAQAQMDALRVVSPLSGTVTRLNVKPGAAVDGNTIVAEVMDLQRLSVSAQIPAAAANGLTAGQTVEITAQPAVTTTLAFVSPTVDASSGTVLVRALLPADSGLRPGQFVPLQITTGVHTNCLAAPAESVVKNESGESVVACVNGDEAAQTPVQTGFQENGWLELAGNGIKDGDAVVTVGAYGLPTKTRIQIANPAATDSSATNAASAQ